MGGVGAILQAASSESSSKVKCVRGGVAQGGVVEDDPYVGGAAWRVQGLGEVGEIDVGVGGVVGAWAAVQTVVVKMLCAAGSGGLG